MKHKFYKTEENRWYVYLPEYIESGIGTLENLEMVAGADDLLDIISNNRNEVNLSIMITKPQDNSYEKLILIPEAFDGSYMLKNYKQIEINLSVWLCPVTLYVFNGEYPETIWFKSI